MSISTKKTLRLLAALLLVCLALLGAYVYYGNPGEVSAEDLERVAFTEGDIIFQESRSPQSRAIQLATGSRYSHCGIIFEKNGRLYVYEAIWHVSWTPLADWINRGVDGHYLLLRLKGTDKQLNAGQLAAMKKAGQPFDGKQYDIHFLWSDEKLYCSELVWKIYERGAGISLTPLRRFKDYKLDSPVVAAVIKKRFGGKLPMDEQVVAPSDILASPLLEQVAGN